MSQHRAKPTATTEESFTIQVELNIPTTHRYSQSYLKEAYSLGLTQPLKEEFQGTTRNTRQ